MQVSKLILDYKVIISKQKKCHCNFILITSLYIYILLLYNSYLKLIVIHNLLLIVKNLNGISQVFYSFQGIRRSRWDKRDQIKCFFDINGSLPPGVNSYFCYKPEIKGDNLTHLFELITKQTCQIHCTNDNVFIKKKYFPKGITRK